VNTQINVRHLINRARDESGMGEVVAMIFIIPLLVGLLFTMIEVSIHLHMRSQVENVINTATAGAAEDGGNDWARSNKLGQPWDTWATSQIDDICGSRCDIVSPPECTPDIVDSLPYATSAYTPAGQDGFVRCSARVKFNALTGPAFTTGPLGFGIGRVANSEATISMELPASRSESGFGF